MPSVVQQVLAGVNSGFIFTQRLNFVGAGHDLLATPTVDLGPNVSKRTYLVISWQASGARALSSVSVGGNAASLAGRAAGSTPTHNLEIWQYTNELTSAELSASWTGGSVDRASVGVFFADDSFTNQNAAASSSATSGTALNVNNNLYDDGYVLAATMWASDGPTVTWTNATEVYDSGRESYAILNETSLNGSYNVSLALSSASTNRRLLFYSAV